MIHWGLPGPEYWGSETIAVASPTALAAFRRIQHTGAARTQPSDEPVRFVVGIGAGSVVDRAKRLAHRLS